MNRFSSERRRLTFVALATIMAFSIVSCADDRSPADALIISRVGTYRPYTGMELEVWEEPLSFKYSNIHYRLTVDRRPYCVHPEKGPESGIIPFGKAWFFFPSSQDEMWAFEGDALKLYRYDGGRQTVVEETLDETHRRVSLPVPTPVLNHLPEEFRSKVHL